MIEDKKIKVLHIHTRAIIGGSGTNTLLSMAGLPKDRFEAVLACGSEGALPEEARKKGLRVIIIPHLKNEINPSNDFLALREIISLLKSEDFAIVHTHNSKAGILGRLAARWCRVPVIVHTMHSCVFRYPNLNFFQRSFFYIIEKWTAGFTDKIIAISPTLETIFIESGIAPPEKIATIYSGIGLESFRVATDLVQKKRSLGIAEGELVVGTVSRLAEGKGHKYIIQAIPLIVAQVPHVKFVFVGDGPARFELEDLADQLRVRDKIIFTGERNDVPELLQAFDIFCLVSLYEGMGRVILEAQAAGKPVVATKIGGIPDIVLENKTAFLIKPKDSTGLADNLIRLLKDEKLRTEMSQAARGFIDYHFSLQKMVEDIMRVYNELLGCHETPSSL